MFSVELSTILPFEGYRRFSNHWLMFNPFWLVGSFSVVFLKRPYQLLSVLTLPGQAPNNEYAK